MTISIIIPSKGRPQSLERCVELVKQHTFYSYEIIIERDAESYSQAVNRGLRKAKGEFLTIPGIANDIEVTKHWDKALVEAFEDKKTGMAIPAVEEYAGRVFGGFISPDAYNFDPEKEPHYAGYGLVSRKVFKRVGFMDENFKPIYLEDADYGFRVRQAGYRIVPCPDSVIIHRHEAEERIGGSSGNREYFNKKWKKWLAQ